METAFCTIITEDFTHYALSLFGSLKKYHHSLHFYILIVNQKDPLRQLIADFSELYIVSLEDLLNQDHQAQIIADKYNYDDNFDCFRWSMKPVILRHLLNKGFNQVFFLDPDLYFFNDFTFLYRELEGSSLLLTPHWRAKNPYKDATNFAILQTSGLFNAGFVGATKSGIPALEWWASVCAYECVKDPSRGLFVDQAYLDLMPIYFEDIKILRHKGCNVANWNQIECERTLSDTGEILINQKWKLIFVHFTLSTIKGIQSGKDYLLTSHLAEYQDVLEQNTVYSPKSPSHSQKTSLQRIKSRILARLQTKFNQD